jgi:large conductance mechanosensitive channel protein
MLVGAFSKLTLQNGLTNQNVSLNNAFFPQLHRKVTNLFLYLHWISQIIIINNKKTMSKFLNEFKDFAMRGNVLDLAVGVIIGGAFGKIVSSVVDDLLMPVIGMLIGGLDFKGLSITIGEAKIMYGNFIQNVIDFTIIAFCIFLLIKGINSLSRKKEEPAAPEAPAEPSNEEKLLSEIRDLLKNKQ